ncbi:hypothetical protein [Kribbella endophytica]
MPAEYEYFLRKIGRGAGDFLVGSDVFYPVVLELKGRAEELLAEWDEREVVLGERSLVVNMHQGYQFVWFDDVREPGVSMYMEGSSGVYRSWPDFADFLIGMADLRGQLG